MLCCIRYGGQSSAVFPVLPCMDFDVNAPCLYFILLIICKTMDGLLSSDCYMCHLYRCDELDSAVDLIRELVIHVWIFFMVLLYQLLLWLIISHSLVCNIVGCFGTIDMCTWIVEIISLPCASLDTVI
jgi:hypothetical protein